MTADKERKEEDILISLCVPQYNRIKFLLQSMEDIAKQEYPHLEIAISDDCSTDTTQQEILKQMGNYKYPIRYERHSTNQGYDRNLRHAIEMASGEYVVILGNDDTINPGYDLRDLVAFIIKNNYPDVGFTNFIDSHTGRIETRALHTAVLGHGPEVAFRYYSCFSFVGGIIFKKSVFLQFNTSEFDGSIYSQIYLATLAVASGKTLFSIAEPVVIKDVLPEAQDRHTYLDHIPKLWKDYKKADGGLPSVIHVMIAAFGNARVLSQARVYGVFRKIYSSTFPYWIVNYRKNRAFPAAVGLISGMRPHFVDDFSKLAMLNKVRVYSWYVFSSIAGLLVPVSLFDFIAVRILKKVKPEKKTSLTTTEV